MVHGTLTVPVSDIINKGNPLSYSLFNVMAFGGKIGVFLFVLITGYFMIYSHISLKKIVKLWLPIFFWSVALALILGTYLHNLTIGKLIRAIFPIIFSQYWFMSTYVFMYLLIPILNRAILSLNIKQEILLTLVGLAVIFPSTHFYGSNVFSWLGAFCFAYAFGALIRKHDLLKKHWFQVIGQILLWGSLLVDIIVAFGFSYVGFALNKVNIAKHSGMLTNGVIIFCLFEAVGLFICIGSKNIKYNKFINTVAATTFGIYLIHDNNFARSFIWNDVFHMKRLFGQPAYVIFYALGICVIVFTICSLMEFIRRMIFTKFENKLAAKVDKLGQLTLSKASEKLVKKFKD